MERQGIVRLIIDILIDIVPKVLIDIVNEYYGVRYIGYEKERDFGDGNYLMKVMCFHNKLYVIKNVGFESYLDIFDMITYELLRSVKWSNTATLNDEKIQFMKNGEKLNIFDLNKIFKTTTIILDINNLRGVTKQKIEFHDWCITKNGGFLTDGKEIFEFDKKQNIKVREQPLIDNKICEINDIAIINDDLFLVMSIDNKNTLFVSDKGNTSSITNLNIDIDPQFISSIGDKLFVSTKKNICVYKFKYIK